MTARTSWSLARWWGWVERAWAYRRQHPTHCAWCASLLPEGEASRWCSRDCALQDQGWSAW